MRWLMKCLAVAGFAAMNIMLLSVSVWSGNADMTPGDARLLPLALGADRAAGRRLCGPAVLPQRLARAPRPRAQHGRADLARRDRWRSACRWSRPRATPQHAYFDSAIMLLFFLLCGRALDHAMRRKTRAVAGNLAALKAEFAHRFDGTASSSRVPAAALQAGDRLLVRPGDRVPADGVVINGSSEIDESLVTGETARRAVAAGAAIYAGSGELLRHADHARHRGGKRHADRRGRAAAREGGRGEIALSCGSPTALPGCMRRWCTRPRR